MPLRPRAGDPLTMVCEKTAVRQMVPNSIIMPLRA